ncbi:restriction endonuclease subunit S [Shewanella sp. JBTF-M18]|uniref:Restriction endonuclease subunit S n=2 Tax=Shewanella insulae TaxID=2681496 RepID=A0A6L7HYR8_9GAMM|nr:restriction endonuclease subunit S [Shewanella insulae]
MTTLGEYIKVQGGYAYKSKDFIESSENKVLKIKNVRFGTVDYSEPAYISDEIAKTTKNWKVNEGDVLISMTGSGPNAPQSLVGRVARVWKNEPDAWINQRVGRICLLDENMVHLDFIFYWLSLPQSQDYLVSNSSGSANQANISGKIIESLPCPKVDYQTSRQIADLARKFDEKIIVNSQTNKTLEEMAQAIFKSWFVDFEPVKAKMNGEQPEGMDAATASLFPEKLDSETGLPEGWKLSEIGDEVTVVGGGTPSKKNDDFWVNGHIHWTSPKDLSGVQDKVLLDTASKVTEAGLKKISSGLLPVDTVLLSSRAPVGYLALAKVPMAINQGYIAMKCEKQLPPEFVIQWCVHRMDEIKQRASGSTFAEISKKSFKPISVVVPSEDTLNAYQKIVKPLYDAITSNARQNEQLSSLRDTLRPKLLSGELSISD